MDHIIIDLKLTPIITKWFVYNQSQHILQLDNKQD